MGLQVGEVLPPQLDNPKGFYESVLIVNENRRILASMDRDWTCPPRALDQSAIDRGRLEGALDEVVSDRTRPWGFKDPRTIFTLEAWLSVLDSVRLLGVYRPAGSVARSLETRDHFSQTAAESIAVLYNERLAQLHQELDFPIVQFGGERDAMLDHMEDLSRQLDLDWDPEFAKSFFETELIHHARPDGLTTADEYLESVVDTKVDLAAWSRHDAISALKRVESHGRFTPSSPYLGPQFLVRRTRLWGMLRRLGGEVEAVLELLPDDRRHFNPLEGVDAERYRRQQQGQIHGLESDRTFTHILATDVLDIVPPDDLDEFLAGLLTMTDIDGVVGLCGHIVDGPHQATAPRSDLDHSRYEHRRDDLEHAIRRLGWHIASWRVDLNVVVLARSARRSDSTVLSPSEMRTRLRGASAEKAALERRLDEADAKLESLSRKLAASQRDYTRLRSRRVVRFSLAVARSFKPVFELVRGGSASSRAKTDTMPGAEGGPSYNEAEVPYVHIRPVTDNDQSSTLVAPRVSGSTPSGDRFQADEAALIRIGLFLPANKSTFPASTHVRVLRRFYHTSVERHLSPVVLDAERYLESESPRQLDIALIQRTGVPATLTDEFVQRMDDEGIPIVLDLDDDIIDMPAIHPDFDAFREWREPLKRLAARADLITASTEALRQRLMAYNDHVVTILNALDSGLWFASNHDQDGQSPQRDPNSFRLLYFGSRTHGGDLRLLEEFVRHPGNATSLTVVGGAPPGTLDWCQHVDPPRASREYPKFVEWLREFASDFDALVAPLADTPFNEAKSDLKFLEGAALGLPVICSDVVAYSPLRGRGVALLCGPTPHEWGAAISAFRDQPDLRNSLAHAGDKYVRSERLLEQQATDLVQVLGDLVSKAKATPG
ncbi:MAG: hypothetical protein ABW021_11185 [Acidimicrobiia bacterium]